MPCVHCASRDGAVGASTSSRCSSSVPIQRVPQTIRSYRQLRRHLKHSRTAVQRAVLQCNTRWQQQTQPKEAVVSQQLSHDQNIWKQSPQQIGRCMAEGFGAAALLTLLTPGPSYSAESLPIGLLKSWVVSHIWRTCLIHTESPAKLELYSFACVQEQVESLGPVVGPLIFVLTMASVEMIPLFPTQPFLLASGLLFGPLQVRHCSPPVMHACVLCLCTTKSAPHPIGLPCSLKPVSPCLSTL